eukprot:TRINITY_DN311_c0_g1_i1.p2 TRINITY_DN311_c0_g1~~TRINITY_DN311_c0_g1_i1.p2  ORF type:complete len:230 (-),score=16.48 TRINITY_DN311_c0_g1_i1:97-786(-)
MFLFLVCACSWVYVDGSRRANPAESIGRILQGMNVPLVSEESTPGSASGVIRGLKAVPEPRSIFTQILLDPRPPTGAESCSRDYGMPCPLQFHSVGDIMGDNRNYCAPSIEYRGACTRPFVATEMSTARKAEWSNECQAFWPCIHCQRNYRTCPEKWTRVRDTRCAPPDTYLGSCVETDFQQFNADMFDEWSSTCGVFWECAHSESVSALIPNGHAISEMTAQYSREQR